MTRDKRQAITRRQDGGVLPWLVGGVVLVGAVIVGGAIGYWLFLNIWLGLTLREQPGAITITEALDVTASVTNVLDVRMNGDINAQVPLNERVTVPMQGRYDLDVSMDAQVPINFEVVYEGVIPVDTRARIRARTDLNFQTIKKYRNIEIETTLPLKFNLPVKLRVPVNETIRFKYDGPLSVVANQNLKTRVNTVLPTTLAVDQTMRVPVTREFGLRMQVENQPVPAIINHADLFLDPSTLRLETKDSEEAVERMDSPFGPAADN